MNNLDNIIEEANNTQSTAFTYINNNDNLVSKISILKICINDLPSDIKIQYYNNVMKRQRHIIEYLNRYFVKQGESFFRHEISSHQLYGQEWRSKITNLSYYITYT